MKRLFIYATAGALSITAMTSFNAYAAGTYNVLGQKGNVVVIGGSISAGFHSAFKGNIFPSRFIISALCSMREWA